MKKKQESAKGKKVSKLEKPIKKANKTSVKKRVVSKVKNLKKDIEFSQEDNEALDIVDEIFEQLKTVNAVEVISGLNYDFIVIAKSSKLSVNKVVNNSVFQPYETNETRDYCLLNIIQVGEQKVIPRFVEELRKMGAIVYKVTRVDQISSVLDSME